MCIRAWQGDTTSEIVPMCVCLSICLCVQEYVLIQVTKKKRKRRKEVKNRKKKKYVPSKSSGACGSAAFVLVAAARCYVCVHKRSMAFARVGARAFSLLLGLAHVSVCFRVTQILCV